MPSVQRPLAVRGRQFSGPYSTGLNEFIASDAGSEHSESGSCSRSSGAESEESEAQRTDHDSDDAEAEPSQCSSTFVSSNVERELSFADDASPGSRSSRKAAKQPPEASGMRHPEGDTNASQVPMRICGLLQNKCNELVAWPYHLRQPHAGMPCAFACEV